MNKVVRKVKLSNKERIKRLLELMGYKEVQSRDSGYHKYSQDGKLNIWVGKFGKAGVLLTGETLPRAIKIQWKLPELFKRYGI